MEVVKAFIALKPGFQASKELELDIMNFIRKKLSAKIMRRVLRAQEWGEEIGDTSTLEND